MPKKGKKGKGKGKKGKKGKGEKAKKKEANIKHMSEANSVLWQARLALVEQSRQEYRETAKRLLEENNGLQNQMQQTEKDTIDVITYLKKQDQEKDTQMEKMSDQMKTFRKEQRSEVEQIVQDFQRQMLEMEAALKKKNQDVEMLQAELKAVKEFRRKRAQMQRELDTIKETMYAANKEHKDVLTRMEQKFFEEKMRLQQEANKKIAELADRAHNEAITNLDETTKSVYKENVRANEALSYHIEEGDMLRARNNHLEEENRQLKTEREMNELVIHEKIAENKTLKNNYKEQQEKVQTLEQSLSFMVREFETERKSVTDKADLETRAAKIEIAKLQRTIELKTKEMHKVKRLARNILDQRTDVERFFLEALEHVRKEIAANQSQYRRDAQVAYTSRMLAAHQGKAGYPKIRTFNKNQYSTNSVFQDLAAAETMAEAPGQVDISELTWEQRERVLRFLFGKMNGDRKRSSAPAQRLALLPEAAESAPTVIGDAWPEDPDDQTFLTQARTEDSRSDRLPSISSASAPQLASQPVT